MNKKIALMGLVPLSLLSAPSFAETASTEAEQAKKVDQSEIGEIIVTATKRSENLQKIPGAIAALGEVELQQRGITSFAALANQVPSLTFGDFAGATFITIRGVGAAVDNGIAEPSVATYVDGIYLARSTMANLDFQDLERVEVLRGPQGTLYGRNATGGAVNFISKKPSDTFGGGAMLRYGNYNDLMGSAYLTGPLADGVNFRVSGGREVADGYIKSIVGGEDLANTDRWQVRGALQIQAGSNVTVDLSALYQSDHSRSSVFQLLSIPTSPFFPGNTPGTTQNWVGTTKPWRVAADQPYPQHKSTLILGGIINWNLADNVTLRSTTGYVDHKTDVTLDTDITTYPLVALVNFSRPSKTFSQELNLSGDTGNLKWLVGAYYFHEKYAASSPALLPSGLAAFGLPPGSATIQALRERTEVFALYTDLTYSITPQLRISGGLRWNHEKKNTLQDLGAIIPGFGYVGASDVASSSKESKLLPRVGIQYEITPDINTYAQFQIGQKSGGQNIATLNAPYEPEQLTAYEAGVKSRLFGGAATFNIAGFYYKYKNLQVLKLIGGTTAIVENAQAKVYGLDIDFNARLTEHIKVNIGSSVIHSEYTDYASQDPYYLNSPPGTPGTGVVQLSGNRLTRTPDYTINAGVDWQIPLQTGPLEDLTLRGEVFRSGKYALSAYAAKPEIGYPGEPGEPVSGYTTVNLAATLNTNKGLQIRGFVNNLTNNAHLVARLYTPFAESFVGSYAPPRTYGVELRYNF